MTRRDLPLDTRNPVRYVGPMRTTGEKITDELKRQGRSQRAFAKSAKVRESTLRLHIKNDDFGMRELGRIADALDVDVRDLLSDELLKITTPGALTSLPSERGVK